MENNEYDIDFSGKEYNFKLGKIIDGTVEECRKLLDVYCKTLVENEEVDTNTNSYAIGTGAKEISDEILFGTAISFYKEHLRKQIEERNKHIIVVSENRSE